VLESMVDDIRSKNREAANLIETLRIVIAEDRRQIDTLNAQLNQRMQTEADLQRQLAGVRADRQTITNALAKAQEQLTIFRESKTLYERQNPQINTGQYGGEIESFQNQIDTMKRIAEQLNHPLLG
jgi:chromosome segregation ATPase